MKTKMLFAMLFVFCIAITIKASAQLSTSSLVPECNTVIDYVHEQQYKEQTYMNLTTGKEETALVYDYDKIIKVPLQECGQPTLTINGKTVNYRMQGYACAQDGAFVMCDSMTDGNGDGKCFDGETCCRVKDGKIACKNSEVGWAKPSTTMRIAPLKGGDVS